MRLRDLLILTLLLALFLGIFLGSRPLSAPDEGRYVEIPREMTVTGDWLTPRLNGVKYFEKPPLFYWLEAALITVFGLSEWSVRIVPALLALFGCLAVYFAGARLYGRPAGLIAAVVLVTSILYYALSRLISPDMPVSVMLTAALLSFLLGTREPASGRRKLFFWSLYVFSGLAVLTKGLIGILFPGMIIFTWMLVTGEWRLLRSMHLLSGTALFFGIAAPWHILVSRANPEFLDFYFIREHFQRYLTTVHHHDKPFWFFIPVILGGLFPWSVFLFQAIRNGLPISWKDRRQHRVEIFLMLWAGLIFLFFSASNSKLIPYILPVLPPLALLIGKYLSDVIERDPPGMRTGVNTLLVLSAMFSVVLGALLIRHSASIPAGTTPYLAAMIMLMMGGAFTTWFFWKGQRIVPSIISLAIATALFGITISAAAPLLDTRSLKPLAMALREQLRPDDEVVHYRNYYQDLPVYLERRMTVADWRGELDFGMTIEDTSGWMINETELRKRWQGPRRIFLVSGTQDAYTFGKKAGKPFFLIAQNKNTVILSNKAGDK